MSVAGKHTSMVDVVGHAVTTLRAMQWTPPGQSQPVPVFGQVDRFGCEEWSKVFLWLLRADRTAAAVVPTGLRYVPISEGNQAIRIIGDMAVLITDRSIGNQSEAVFGGAENAGVMRIAEWVGSTLDGGILPQGGTHSATLLPQSGEQVWIEDEGKKYPGRAAYAMEVEAILGRLPRIFGTGQVR